MEDYRSLTVAVRLLKPSGRGNWNTQRKELGIDVVTFTNEDRQPPCQFIEVSPSIVQETRSSVLLPSGRTICKTHEECRPSGMGTSEATPIQNRMASSTTYTRFSSCRVGPKRVVCCGDATPMLRQMATMIAVASEALGDFCIEADLNLW